MSSESAWWSTLRNLGGVSRDSPGRYDVLIENLIDPAHVPYAHYGIMRTVDMEGGRLLDLNLFSPGGSQSVIKKSSNGTKDVVLPPVPPKKRAMLISTAF
ncbi:ACD1-like protein [Perilla frutescens var. frutescens]|nr:ACD1-like protein [Perilla frutescens var. frutescens]